MVLDFKKVGDYRSSVFINFELLLGWGGGINRRRECWGERGKDSRLPLALRYAEIIFNDTVRRQILSDRCKHNTSLDKA